MNSLVAYGDSDSESEHEERVGTTDDKTQERRVRIGLPKLDKEDESDEEVPSAKRLKPGSGVGLTAILPQPRGTMREPEKPVKLTTKNMVPYSLLKKKQDAKRLASVKQSSAQQGSDEESDEDPAAFFSHLDSSTPKVTDNITECTSKAIRLPGVCPVVTKPVLPTPVIELMKTLVTTNDNNSADTVPTSALQGTLQPTHSSALWDHLEGLPDHRQPEQPMDEEAFRRLAGGRNLKLKSESLDQIVELDECQVQGRIKDYQKYMTEEQPTMPKGPAPTNMQKKKHQLHYLIHQAQAREVELRNHWAQAAQNKRQSGMKYGFF
ncbi:hypothetical protein EMCRGX_G034091 [Ephydatia muelleri]